MKQATSNKQQATSNNTVGYLSREPIDVSQWHRGTVDVYSGASVEFVGIVRADEDGRPISALDYEAYEPMAERMMARLIEHVIDTVRPLVEELIVSVRDARQVPRLAVHVVEDLVPDAHALGGLYTGLRAASYARCFVCACDAPFLHPALIRFLIEQADGYDLVVPETDEGLHPLHAVYATSIVPVIEAQLRARRLSLRALARKVCVKRVAPKLLARYDPTGLSFLNLNTPEDYVKARGMTRIIDAEQGRR